MATENALVFIGNLTDQPELKFTKSGVPVLSVNVAHNPRVFDRDANEWKDGDPTFIRGTLWRDQAEHAASSLGKGTRVVVIGALKQRSFDDKDGNKRTVLELEVDEIAPSLKYATAEVTRIRKGEGGKASASQPTAKPAEKPVAAVSGGSDDDWDF